jgi:hypothetical protein
MDARAILFYVGRFLQVVGMGLTLYGLVLSMYVGLREKDSLHSMSIEFQYLGAGGALFIVGLFLVKRTQR